jgi:heme/copper-type cytochrome/quinol oxidase subunit 3
VKRTTTRALGWVALGVALGALYVRAQVPGWVRELHDLDQPKPAPKP